MKIDGAPGYVPAKPHQAVRHPKPATSFKEAFDGLPVTSSQYAISFDATGLLGAGKTEVGEETPAFARQPDASQLMTPMSLVSADGDNPAGTGFAASPASAASVMIAGANAGGFPKPVDRAAPAERRLHLHGSTAGPAVSVALATGVSPGFRGLAAAEASVPVAPLPAQSVLSAKSGYGAQRADGDETPEPALSDPKTDGEAAGPQADGGAEALSVIIAESDGDVQIIVAVPDVSDEARRQVREAAHDIAREAGVRISGLSLNGTTLIHKPELDRRTSWRSHL
ncbi:MULTISPECIES: hypothetical protein [Asticcacaulis]|uniref:hypothetical protein n=1 Tax=Asticcacaulis TaxID=76890 RepID=UPI001AE97C02|nr:MULTISPECIES: hypothetical protein [Asticcacaulis]MBP2161172.1 hypothetical protein [Asticcacaulis solisilvae]MDR6802217.1 hypothetical protein [Asticcacaulis sp. BE141]